MDRPGHLTRFQRVLQILLHLQTGPRFNAAELAQLFGVSRRTVYRDLGVLREAGIPVIFDEAHDAYRLPPSHRAIRSEGLDIEELCVLAAAAKTSPVASLPGQAARIERALTTLLSVFPQSERDQVAALMSGCRPAESRPRAPDSGVTVWTTVLNGIRHRQRVHIRIDQGDSPLDTDFSPYCVFATESGWSVFGQASDSPDPRLYSIDAIVEAHLTDVTFDLPREIRKQRSNL